MKYLRDRATQQIYLYEEMPLLIDPSYITVNIYCPFRTTKYTLFSLGTYFYSLEEFDILYERLLTRLEKI